MRILFSFMALLVVPTLVGRQRLFCRAADVIDVNQWEDLTEWFREGKV